MTMQLKPSGIHVRHRETCRLCDSRDLELVVPLAPSPVAEKYVTREQLGEPTDVYGLDLHMCRQCGHVQLLDVIDPDFLWDAFTYRSGQNKAIVDHFEDCAAQICSQYQPAAGDLVIDIGSNDGTMLRAFKNRGLRVLGVDPAREIAELANQSGLETIVDFLTPELARQMRHEYGPARIITAFNVYAHVDDLAAMTQSIAHVLDRDGVFVFEVSYLLDVIDRMLLGTIFHEHLCYHSVTSLDSFLKRHGMELIDVRRVPVQGGSLIGTAQRVGSGRQTAPSVAELRALEQQRGLGRIEILRDFAARLRRLRAEVAERITGYRGQGQTVAGYGAARSGTTLIAQMGLEHAIEYIVDDHPQKVNKFSPGSHIPVVPTSELLLRKPDYCFILAWIHADKIIANNRAYLEQGGRFIVCCPELKVVGLQEATQQ